MLLIEMVKAHDLMDYGKTYKNVYGNEIDPTQFTFDELCNLKVKSVDINFPTKHATITVIY